MFLTHWVFQVLTIQTATLNRPPKFDLAIAEGLLSRLRWWFLGSFCGRPPHCVRTTSMSLSKLFILVNCNLVLDLEEHEQSSDGMNENSWSQFNRNKLFSNSLEGRSFLDQNNVRTNKYCFNSGTYIMIFRQTIYLHTCWFITWLLVDINSNHEWTVYEQRMNECNKGRRGKYGKNQ